MEFHEKLQQLRKSHQLTQEQLAEQLFVSRTAVSKWESGRGYPNLESLKCISKLFSVSIDELLSNGELIELAETENRANIDRVTGLVFGILDLVAFVFLFMPLYGQADAAQIQSVTLAAHTNMSALIRILYVISLLTISALGMIELILGRKMCERHPHFLKYCSITLHAAAILLFAMSRQPYVTAFLFLLFVVKLVLVIRKCR